MTNSFVIFSRGKPYPLKCPKQDTAVADFLRNNGNRLLIVLSGMNSKEEQAFRYGMITAGFLYREGAMLWLLRFYGKDGRPLFTFDAPFDVRLIPKDEWQLHHIDNAEQRLAVDLHAIDDRGILRAIRLITMPPEMTIAFLSAVQEQLAESNSGSVVMAQWMKQQPNQLFDTIKTWTLGK